MEKNEDDYLRIFKALEEIPFGVGRNLLADFLAGDYKNKSILKNRLDELDNFGALEHWSNEKINSEINNLISNGMIEQAASDYNDFARVLKITLKGRREIISPTMINKKLKNKMNFCPVEISEFDVKNFSVYEDFLRKRNDEQKKAIISEAEKILCVAGAGSGKTSVLIKRIEFLVRHKNILPGKILAITFTRKARREMEKRLETIGVGGVNVHTFNSFCEDILRKHGSKIYKRATRVQSYSDKIIAMNIALANLGLSADDAINKYFSKKQREFRTQNQLMNIFMNDCFSVIEFFKILGEEYDFSKNADSENFENAKMVYQINNFLKEHMGIQGLRDFTDQMIDAVRFLESNNNSVPSFEHILVDEYQDVNAMQIELLKILNPKNLFAVGDPRQAIFGWRGSDIKFILNFEKDFGAPEIIYLSKNYRSLSEIVNFMNLSVKGLGLPDLESHRKDGARITLNGFDSEEDERNFAINEILQGGFSPSEIFVLARTNRQLMELSKTMKERGIIHFVKNEDEKNFNADGDGVVLATIHSIKGLQAKKVFVVGCNEQNFPCKANDHPVIEMIKPNEYDREEEEKRLFYVAISRARDVLHLTYSGKKPTYFINEEMKKIIES